MLRPVFYACFSLIAFYSFGAIAAENKQQEGSKDTSVKKIQEKKKSKNLTQKKTDKKQSVKKVAKHSDIKKKDAGKKPAGIVANAVDYYTAHPAKGQGADGRIPAGTKVQMVEEVGSYVRVIAQIEVYIPAENFSAVGKQIKANKQASVDKANLKKKLVTSKKSGAVDKAALQKKLDANRKAAAVKKKAEVKKKPVDKKKAVEKEAVKK